MGSKQFIGLDVGRERTGLARASTVAKLAEPIGAVPTEEVSNRLKELNRSESIEALVIGLPRGLEGQETGQTAWVRQWVEHLKEEAAFPIYAQDEALTTKLAEARRLAGKQIHDIDALAASIILQDFLDTPEAGRVVL